MVKAFPALGTPVGFFDREDALFGEGVVGECLSRGNRAVLLRLWLWLLCLLLLLLLALQVDSLVPGEGGGVIEPLAAVSTGVALSF